MIIWKGRGILIVLFAILGFAGGVALDSIKLAVWLAAAAVWLVALTFGKTTQKVLLDPQTGQQVVFKNSHTLFFIPAKGWAVLMTIFALFMTFAPEKEKGPESSEAAQAAFKQADDLVSRKSGTGAHGNTPEATALATKFNEAMERTRDMMVEKGGEGEFLTYAYITKDRCVLLVQVPKLRKYSRDDKKVLGQVVWANAQLYTSQLKPRPAKLAVGVRGSILYDRAYIGSPDKDAAGGDSDIAQEIEGNDSKYALIALFEPAGKTAIETADAKTGATNEPEPNTESAPTSSTEKPTVPVTPAPPAAETTVSQGLPTAMRDWKDSTGRPLRASMTRFVNPERTQMEFKREDGQVFEVPLDRFSEEDQKFIQSLSAE